MKRALLVVCLAASPAAAQVGPHANPYNPYANASAGTVQLRPYISLDRLNIQYQSRMISRSYGATGGVFSTVANPIPPAAAFGYYPNYPLMNSSLVGSREVGKVAPKSMKPLPFSAPQPVEVACDPYMSEDGCLSKYAGW